MTLTRDLGAAPTVHGVVQRALANDCRLVRLPDGRPIGPGEFRWREWLRTASLEDRMAAWEQLPEPKPTAGARQRSTLERLGFDPSEGHECLAVPGTEEEFRIAASAVAHAIRCGKRLPPFRMVWFAPGPADDWADGIRGTTYHTVQPVRVYLRAGLEPAQLLRTTLHELQHVEDAADLEMSTADREARAESFVIEAMARWGREERTR